MEIVLWSHTEPDFYSGAISYVGGSSSGSRPNYEIMITGTMFSRKRIKFYQSCLMPKSKFFKSRFKPVKINSVTNYKHYLKQLLELKQVIKISVNIFRIHIHVNILKVFFN